MRDLIIDMTPTFINKTAIYHIANDTFAALACDYRVRSQIRGEIVGDARPERVALAFSDDIARFAAESAHVGELAAAPPERGERAAVLFFDPIYTLYQPLGANDVVLVLDLSTLTNPEWHAPAVVRCYEQAFRKISASRARIATISDHCTTALRANFSIPADEITTVPLYMRDLPRHEATAPAAALTPRRFFLFVGSMESRKNVVGLMRAFALSGLVEEGWTLALAGGPGIGADEIRAAARDIEGVHHLGFVTDAELAWLYENAAAFAYASYLEGFGLPLLEAMAHGVPCMASITGASPEVCLDLGVMVDPYHTISIVDGLRRCAELAQKDDPGLRARLIARAEQFTFDRYIATLKTTLPPPGSSKNI